VAFSYLKTVPTSGNDLYLIVGCALVGATFGGLAAKREAEVLTLIAEGLSNAEIAARLFVAETTIKTHINRIFAKTQSRDRAQAAPYAQRHGLAAAGGAAPGSPGPVQPAGPNSLRVLSPSSTKSTPLAPGATTNPKRSPPESSGSICTVSIW